MAYKDYDTQYLQNRVYFHSIVCEEFSLPEQKSMGTLNTTSMFIPETSVKNIENSLKDLKNMVEDKRKNILSNFQKVIDDNKEFKRTIKNKSPKNSISITSYQYRNDFLLNIKKSIELIIDDLLTHSQDINVNTKMKEIEKNPLYSGRSQTEKFVLDNIIDKIPNSWKSQIQKIIDGKDTTKKKKNTNASTILELFHYIRDTYRGNKINIKITSDTIGEYQEKINVLDNISADAEERFRKLLSIIKKEESNIKSSLASNSINPEQQSRFNKFVDSLTALVNFYISFYEYYQDLRLEENFTSKAILLKIYEE